VYVSLGAPACFLTPGLIQRSSSLRGNDVLILAVLQ